MFDLGANRSVQFTSYLSGSNQIPSSTVVLERHAESCKLEWNRNDSRYPNVHTVRDINVHSVRRRYTGRDALRFVVLPLCMSLHSTCNTNPKTSGKYWSNSEEIPNPHWKALYGIDIRAELPCYRQSAARILCGSTLGGRKSERTHLQSLYKVVMMY